MLPRLLILIPLRIARSSARSRRQLIPSFIHNHADIQTQKKSWIDSEYIPKAARPYLHLARADKQVGTTLLFWPCLWSIALAAPAGSLPHIATSLQFAVGAVIMRSAGCIINDMWDRDFDKHVERTKNRPLASGDISMNKAMLFLAAHLSAGLGILLSLNTASVQLGFLVMPMVIGYPLMKRFTNWPQLFLGMTFNWYAQLFSAVVI
jgi:4-hydroxybenzoate polyprenyltransferase